MQRSIHQRGLQAVGAIALVTLLAACQRNEAPTPGVAGGSANPPAAASSAPATVPTAPESTSGTGKSPGMETPQGSSGAGGAISAPSPDAAQAPASAPPAIPSSSPNAAMPGSSSPQPAASGAGG